MASVAVFADHYLPGFRAGGPVISISRLLRIQREASIEVFTKEHDLGDAHRYPGIAPRSPTPNGTYEVSYLGSTLRDAAWVRRELRSLRPDLYYFNSVHSIPFALIPFIAFRARLIPQATRLIAPRGELSTGAQNVKPFKKRIGRRLIRALIGYGVVWHLSSERELQDLITWLDAPSSDALAYVISPDLPPTPAAQASSGSSAESPLAIIFASRIHPIKGLDTALETLASTTSTCRFDVYGSITDKEYWRKCQELATRLPDNVSFEYHGDYRPEQAADLFAAADLFLLPSRGENFGHAIAEALSVGCPVAISTKTPWGDFLDDGFGIASDELADVAGFIDALAGRSPAERQHVRYRSLDSYRTWFAQDVPDASNFFNEVLDATQR